MEQINEREEQKKEEKAEAMIRERSYLDSVKKMDDEKIQREKENESAQK